MTTDKPKAIALISSSVSRRTKWDRATKKKLSKTVYLSRLIFKDASGKRRERTKEFLRKRDAEDHAREQRLKFERTAGRELDADRMTFNDLALHYEKHYAKEAEYSHDRKVSGLRSLGPVKTYLSTLKDELGGVRLSDVTYSVIREYRSKRLRTPVTLRRKLRVLLTDEERKLLGTKKKYGTKETFEQRPRKVASVNRELTTLRHMLSIAESEGWIPKNPFRNGKGLIEVSAEDMRQRILSREEEIRLLEVCDCERRSRLRSIIICLLDTGMRFKELTTLKWDGVDLDRNVINIKAFNTKTAKPKTVAISARLRLELLRLRDEFEDERILRTSGTEDLVFGIRSNVKTSWTTARRLAGLEDVRLHDLRHTFATRLNQLGLSQASIARSLGHQQISTTYRYTNSDETLIQTVKHAIDGFHGGPRAEVKKSDEMRA